MPRVGLASFDAAGRSDDVGYDTSPQELLNDHVTEGGIGATDTEGRLNNIQ